jgi:NAD(P)-dependent dehydrogenase (short-subunit alcohol dehydrogenase family)
VHINETDTLAYNASKGAIGPLTKTAALHCCEAGYSIRVNAIYPGAVYTPMMEQDAVDKGVAIDQYLKEVVKQYCPIGRMGKPEDIAYAVLYLASDESSFVTGSGLVIDGGISAK